eukprot:CAMPEP_0119132790 /NCGR_PEP_ID=MMETSP1310-20130426/12308_1 /TAXON_ID=464262 /ORGANISM="Genus nov. species nov., Strain RCC2339" /LENGTH=214 /DNA_ID=CAMNT_0007123445 /DNA_START=31 /DNA_END=675 /DNA_ORIENTATION=+
MAKAKKTIEKKELSLSRRAIANRIFRKRKSVVRSMIGLESVPCSYQGTAVSLVDRKGQRSLVLGRVVSIDTFREVLKHSNEICDLLSKDKQSKPQEITSETFRELEKKTVLSELKMYLEAVEEVIGKEDFQKAAVDALNPEDARVKWKGMPKKKLLLILRRVHEKHLVHSFHETHPIDISTINNSNGNIDVHHPTPVLDVNIPPQTAIVVTPEP